MAVILVIAGGALGVYLSTAQHRDQAKHEQQTRPPALSGKVTSVQTVGIVDVGPYDDGDGSAWPKDADDHPLMLMQRASSVDFLDIPATQLSFRTPEWTADQMSDGSEIFIYIPTGKCLSPNGDHLLLAHCDLGPAQRWRTLYQRVVLGEPVAEYANAKTGACLTAPRKPGQALLAPCGHGREKAQEIAFWWGA
jgi:hypothetical protein